MTSFMRVTAETRPDCTGVLEMPSVCKGVAETLPVCNRLTGTPPLV